MGSVATKIVEKITHIPVLIIGKIPPDQKILVAVDGSETSMRAVDFVANVLGGFPYEIHLLHVIRGASEKEMDRLFFTKESVTESEVKIKTAFNEMTECLLNAGFSPNQIKTKIILNARSRAGSIVQEARDDGFGTIVIGRRGLSHVQEFFMGRVSNKIIHTIRNRAVWVVT
jgi:nucleotide-binding universal stress UspA family protein